MPKELTLYNNTQQITVLAAFIENLSEEMGLDATLTFNLNLALEEAVTNVIMYAYPQDEEHTMTLKAWTEEDKLAFELKDQGVPFNPVKEAPEVDTSLPAEEREIGGLGIYLILKIMDEVSYKYDEGSNILTMKKIIK